MAIWSESIAQAHHGFGVIEAFHRRAIERMDTEYPKRLLQEHKEWDAVKTQARCRWQGADDFGTMIVERGAEPGVGVEDLVDISCAITLMMGGHISLRKTPYRWQRLISYVMVDHVDCNSISERKVLAPVLWELRKFPLITTAYFHSFRLPGNYI